MNRKEAIDYLNSTISRSPNRSQADVQMMAKWCDFKKKPFNLEKVSMGLHFTHGLVFWDMLINSLIKEFDIKYDSVSIGISIQMGGINKGDKKITKYY